MKLILPQALVDLVEPQLRAEMPDLEIVHIDREGNTDGDLSDAEALIRWWMSKEVLGRVIAAAPRLRWLHTPSAGVDGMLLPELRERGITFTNSAGAHAIQIAEFVLMFMLAHVKQARTLAALSPADAWERGDQMGLQELYGKTVLVLGLGKIGQEVAKRAAAFGMRVWGSRRRVQPTEWVERVVDEDGWRALLPEVDYLVVATPLTDATRGMVDRDAFAQLKQGAYLVNIARGQIVDTDALLEALRSGKLAGAGLDALPTEPLPPDHPLWAEPNVWITPHISWSSPQTYLRVADLFVENLRRFRAGQPLLNVVDQEAGY
ncbi:MAG TPA: D-2-hydroxyacid dehydrogenase [Roseiflexaceae bacterium]|nr:D-2-hydroxyacid dehydrogenase [Roseiflexaceae bacterium]